MSLTARAQNEGHAGRGLSSTTRFPNLADVKAELRQRVAGSETIGPLGTVGYPWGAVGMALDYRIRLPLNAALGGVSAGRQRARAAQLDGVKKLMGGQMSRVSWYGCWYGNAESHGYSR